MAIVEPMLADPQYVEDLTADERAVWDSYQRFLHCFVSPGPLSYDGLVIGAALLALATASLQKPKASSGDETQGFSSGD